MLRGRSVLPSSRQQQQRDRRSLPCQLALQDHNYVSRPPPTPPPPQSPPPILRDVLEEHQRKQRAQLQQHPHPNDPSFNAALRGLTPELPRGRHPAYPAYAPPPQQSPAGLVAAVTGPPGSNATAGEPIGTSVLPSRVQANLNSIEEAGVGPMAPLVDDDNSQLSASSNDEHEHGGEETETAPEGEAEDDSITRCICDYLHDDGYMICCDKCLVWQHVVCMGLDKNNIPDEYLCEVCEPRPIDRKRAKALQARRRSELFNNSSSSDGEGGHGRKGSKGKRPGKKILDRKADQKVVPPMNASGHKKQPKLKKGGTVTGMSLVTASLNNSSSSKDAKGNKKPYRKRKPSEKTNNEKKINTSPKRGGVPNSSRRKSQTTFNDTDGDSGPDSMELEPMVDASQQVRSWIDQYEEAVTNHYSPELRARLAGSRINGIGSDLRASVIGGPTKCNVSLKGNGVKILTAGCSMSGNTPVIECKGKLMLASQFRAANKTKTAAPPYVFFYQLGDILEICLDGKTYGNDGRFCRRSADYNAELRHIIDKGSLHLFIVSVKNVEKNQEILLPPDFSSEPAQPLPSINADLREIKKPNGLLASPEEAPLVPPKERVSKKDKKKLMRTKPNTTKEENNINRKTRAVAKIKTEEEEEEPIKVEPKEEKEEVDMTPEDTKPIKINGTKQEVDDNLGEEEEDEEEEDEDEAPSSPTKYGHPKTSPGKLGLPDSSGLIVGVNTINYDASSALRNKAKSREERKMEMIMKAFEAMERAEQRKKDTAEGRDEKPANKRRRSSSSYKHGNSIDSNLDASSADESRPEVANKRSRKKGRKSGPSTPQRRRSRVMSGGSVSNMSADETVASVSTDSATANVQQANGPFRFPKTKKSMMSDWLQESETAAMVVEDDDVSANYLRGSRSPPGIATHLLRSTPHSPVKSVCSAKKRWLRQAISEDHSDDVLVNGAGSPSEVPTDYVTPLKKRRLANYKEDQEQDEADEAEVANMKVPNGLKKKLLQNLVLEAVLDRAMEDMLATPTATATTTTTTETKSEVQVQPEVTPRNNPADVKTSSSAETTIKTPEPSSVFKSFFKSNVSIEALEAELEATKRQREAEQKQVVGVGEAVHSEAMANLDVKPKKENTMETTVEDTSAYHPGEEKNELLVDEINNKLPIKCDTPEIVAVNNMPEVFSSPPPLVQKETISTIESDNIKPELHHVSPSLDSLAAKPKKKRVSLADYKRRRQQDSSCSQEATTPTNTETTASRNDDHEGPGTPTLDEQIASLTAPPTLNTLPLFEKLDKLEQAQQESKKKVQQSSLSGLDGATSPVVEPKREDLTSRLQKEFGLLVGDDTGDDGDATPEESSPPPPPPPSGPPPSQTGTRFLPTQIPSYPPNYPLPPFPSAKYTVPPPAVTTLVPVISGGSSGGGVPPPPPPGAMNVPPPPMNYPTPPPPQSAVKYTPVAVASSSVPPPQLVGSKLDELKSNGSSSSLSSSGSGSTNSGRRPPLSSSRDYYSHNNHSPGGGNRGYYTGSGGGSHRDRSREHGRDNRDRDRERDRDRDRERERDRDREQRERDRDRDRDHRSSSSGRDSSSRRNAFHSRSYY